MNLTKGFLRKLILEQVDELFSADAEETEGTDISKDSADDQIDSFILKFERDSIVSDNDALDESFINMSLSSLIKEQDEEEEDAAPEEPSPDPEPDTQNNAEQDVEDPDPVTSSEVEVEDPAVLPKLPIDMDEFTKKVARLAMNYDKLLDIKSIIINRALSFLSENYDSAHVQEMREILDTQFDFDLGGGSEIPPAPFAIGANPAGAGNMGGGGG